MAKRGSETCYYLVFALLSTSIVANAANQEKEIGLLLSFKASLSDPLRFLSNWNSSVNICSWSGISCDSNSSYVTKISLPGKNMSGEVSQSLFLLPFIETIDLSDNQISGELPRNMFFCLSLRNLNLNNNNFTGTIPRGSNPGLETLYFSNNMFSGDISEDIQLFSGLKKLDLGGNELRGNIPISISKLVNLEFLTLSSNHLVGEIPRELGLMRSLKWIYLGYNNLSGVIPKELGNLSFLSHLDLVYNNLTGEIPSSIGNLTELQYLFLYQNRLTGLIPLSVFESKNLISLDLSGNYLTGEIPELVTQLKKLEILHLFSNNIKGRIPNALASLPRLRVLQLWSNKLSGEIPKNLGKLNNLTLVDLSTNNLTGKIPEGLCASGHLIKLILFSNSLLGEIPKNLTQCRSLKRVRIQNNRFSGELSKEFTKLPHVNYLDISDNMFSGGIHQSWDMPALEMLNLARNKFSGNLPETFSTSVKLQNLDLSKNGFFGNIPIKFGKLSELVQLKLSNNELSGFIPEELSSCKKLVYLDVSHNWLTGRIPDWLSAMPVLSELDLSDNRLSGEIPRSIGKVESLVQVNLSHNRFHGRLPSTGAFVEINASAVAGNNLCSGNVVTGLPPCKMAKTPILWVLLSCGLVVLVLVLLTFFGFILLRRQRKTSWDKVDEDGIWTLRLFDSRASHTITVDDVLSSMRDENIISRGKNGILYKGKSVAKGIKFVAKEISASHSLHPNFWKDILELGNLRHPNVVKLMGICRSEKVGVLVYEFIDGNNLSDGHCKLNWEIRCKITIGVAKALRYIHSQGTLVGNISMDKVIVNKKGEARLKRPLPGFTATNDSKGFFSSIYVAPGTLSTLPLYYNLFHDYFQGFFVIDRTTFSETKERMEITEKSEVYAFGVLLIEILTGRHPTDSEAGVHHNVVDWAHYSYSDCLLDTWIDPALKASNSNHLKEIVETMNVAIQCTHNDPSARPCSSNVLKSLASVLRSRSCLSGAPIF
ncbi:hypothetical protein GIB67_043159 [Kingdonia uniflora]|uniref:non-specific serine/threonine protein kinase n=1 Tax=Kingdonia uniflora TaxID=39325 RepID=A0A7J7NK72_9MAGN|nr:hypothetical protein GIB67_043159 [Kingdonia uniflora]